MPDVIARRLSRALAAVGIEARADVETIRPMMIAPLPRPITSRDARSLAPVYRAVQVITTAAAQLSLTTTKQGRTVQNSALIDQPSPYMTRGEWLTHIITSLCLHGNAYALVERDTNGSALALRPLDPDLVYLTTATTSGAPRYHWAGRDLTRDDILHVHLQPARLDSPLGLGPLQSARADLDGALQTRDFAAQWFTGTGQPTGILSSPTATYADAIAARNAWNGLDADGNPVDQTSNPSRVKVLPKGFTYTPLGVSPKEAQWLESQEFTILQVARLFGIPSTLMLAAPQGGSMTYSNVEQDWIAFTRFTLMAYLRPIEEALTRITPNGQTIRFNLETLLRSDTKTRYEAHQIGITAGFLTVDEVRDIEGRPPLGKENTDDPENS